MPGINEYVYSRIKNVFTNENGETELFLIAGLTLNELGVDDEGPTIKIKQVVSEMIESLIDDNVPASYINMKNHDLYINIDKEEFERLKDLFEDDLEAFFTYTPTETKG